MGIHQTQKQCPTCSAPTLHQRSTFSSAGGCILTVITGGLFIPIWMLIAVCDSSSSWRCQQCGTANGNPAIGMVATIVIVIAALFGLIVFGGLTE